MTPPAEARPARERRRGARGRVLIVVHNLPVPVDRRVWLEATTLRDAGYRVSVICPKDREYDESHEVLEGVDIHRYRVPFEARGYLGYAVEFLWCFLRTFMKSVRIATTGPGFDVLHACNPPDIYWIQGLLWKAFGKGFVFDHHDLSPEMYRVKFDRDGKGLTESILRWLERASLRTADVVITTNSTYRNVAMERAGVPEEKIFVVRSGPDLTRFELMDPDPEWRNGSPHVLAYLGEMVSQDGIENLIEALHLLATEHGRDDFHCLLVGGGPHKTAIQQLTRELGIEVQCTFTGRVSDDVLLSRILSSADLGVIPDPRNPYSEKCTMNKPLEYMFFELPVVGFDLTENKKSAGDAGTFVNGNSTTELARRIDELLDAPERRQEMGRLGRERIEQELAWQHSVPDLLNAYDEAFRDRVDP